MHQASPGEPKLDLGSINFSSSLDSDDMENDIGIRLQEMVSEKNNQSGRSIKFMSNSYKSNSINIVSSDYQNDNDNDNSNSHNTDDSIDIDIDTYIDKNGMNCSAGIVKGMSLLNPFKAPYGRLPINDTDTIWNNPVRSPYFKPKLLPKSPNFEIWNRVILLPIVRQNNYVTTLTVQYGFSTGTSVLFLI